MRQKHFFITFLCLVGAILQMRAASPPLVDWAKCLGGSNSDFSSKIIKSSSGKIWVLGNVDSNNQDVDFNHGSTDIWLSQISDSGQIVRQFSFGGSSIDIATSIVEENGNFIIAGYTSSFNGDVNFNHGGFDAWVFCVDTNGVMLWQNTLGGSNGDLIYSMTKSNTGGFILSGGSFSNDFDLSLNHGDEDAWVLKIDDLGNLLWSQSFGGTNLDVLYGVVENSSGEIFVCGTSNSNDGDINSNFGNYDWLILKLNTTGNLIFSKTCGGSLYDAAQTMIISTSQTLLIGGYSRSNDFDLTSNYGSTDCWLIEMACNGSLVNSKTFGGSQAENIFDLKETFDGGFIVAAGTTSSNVDVSTNLGGEDVWILKLDMNFNIEWKKSFGGSNNDRPSSIIQKNSNEFMFAGYTYSSNLIVTGNRGMSDIWLVDLNCKTPSAQITPSGNVFCLGDTINLTCTSVNSSSNQWNFNGTITSDQALNVVVNTSGNYSVLLTSQTCSNVDTLNFPFLVNGCNLPSASFSSDQTTICQNSTVQFSDHSINALNYSWTFQGGFPSTSTDQNPIIEYTIPGSYTVMLSVTNTFGSQTLMRVNGIIVNPLPVQPIIAVNGNVITSTIGANYFWFNNSVSLVGMNSQVITALSDGFYFVEVTNEFNCSSISDSIYISINKMGDNTSQENQISLFPIPTNKILRLKYEGKNEIYRIFIYNTIGQRVLEILKPSSDIDIDISDYKRGNYFVSILYSDGGITKKIIQKN